MKIYSGFWLSSIDDIFIDTYRTRAYIGFLHRKIRIIKLRKGSDSGLVKIGLVTFTLDRKPPSSQIMLKYTIL
jgi:hypothetical protein